MSDKPEVQHVADQPVASRGFLGAVGAHFKKWWWVHLIIFAAVVLIITLPLYVPKPPNKYLCTDWVQGIRRLPTHRTIRRQRCNPQHHQPGV